MKFRDEQKNKSTGEIILNFSRIKLQIVKDRNCTYNSRTIKSALDIVKVINEIEKLHLQAEESTILICLNTKNQIISYSEIAKGGINFCNVDIKTIMKTILLCNSNKFIIAHNHPSGSSEPSKNDIQFTNKLEKASKVLDIQFLDHIIVCEDEYISCKSPNTKQ